MSIWSLCHRLNNVNVREYVAGEDMSDIEIEEGVTPKLGDKVIRYVEHPEVQVFIPASAFYIMYGSGYQV